MPAWKDLHADEDRWNVVNFLCTVVDEHHEDDDYDHTEADEHLEEELMECDEHHENEQSALAVLFMLKAVV